MSKAETATTATPDGFKDAETATFSPELIKQAARLLEEEKLEEEARKKGFATWEREVYAFERSGLRPPDGHTDMCRCRRVTFPSNFKPRQGDTFEVNKFDRIPREEGAYRKLTAEEAADAVPLEAAQRLRDVQRPAKAAGELVTSVQRERSRAEGEREAIERRIADLGDSLKIAEDRVAATAAAIDKHLEDLSPEKRARVVALAASFEARCAPAPPSQEPTVRTPRDLERERTGDEGLPRACTVGANGQVRALRVDRP